MKTQTFVIMLLTCGLLPFILISDKLDQVKSCFHQCTGIGPPMPKYVPGDLTPRDCADLYRAGYEESGVYNVYVYIARYTAPVPVYCDMETDGGGWLVFQRRQDGSVDFFRNWTDYANGFGNIAGEFWLGNDLLHLLSDHEPQQLRVDLCDHEGHRAYAKYGQFHVGPLTSSYTLNVSDYSGNAGDSLANHDNMKFSTKDSDNDNASDSCALDSKAAWWYNECAYSNLNGLWRPAGRPNNVENIFWYNWRRYTPIRFTEMKMRPLTF